jgi:hypothetical protein
MRRVVGWSLLLFALLGVGVVVARLRLGERSLAPAAPVHVHDDAGLLFPFGVVVEGQGKQLRRDLGIDVQVVTLRAGEPIAPLAERLFRERKVGSDSPTGGILILLDGKGGQARIEVSYSLEGVLPDAFVSRVARDQLVPYASHRAAGMAVMDVVHYLRDRLLDNVATGELALAPELRDSSELEKLLTSHSGGAGAQVALPELPSHTEYKRRVPDERRAHYAPSVDPRETADALRRVQRDLVGDPTLDLFTEGSQVMRARYPIAPYEEILRVESSLRSEPLELKVRGDRAYLGSSHPARGFVPTLMVRGADGLWRVDLVETFKSFFFTPEGGFILVNRASPYAAFASESIDRTDHSLSPLSLHGESLDGVLARLERSRDAGDRFLLAELLMRNCFVSAEALPLYAEAAKLAPHDPTIVFTFADRASYMYMPIIAADAVAGLGPRYFTKAGWLYETADEKSLARSYYAKALDHDPRDDYARKALARLAE